MRVVRFSSGLRHYFTANELSGWPDWVQFTPAVKKAKKKNQPQRRDVPVVRMPVTMTLK